MPEKLKAVKHRRPSICTSEGLEFNFLNPDANAITINSISEGLSKCARYAGQTPGVFYSVAEHSVLVSRLVPKHLALAGLFHDCAEAWMGDVSSPLKRIIGPNWKELERIITHAVFKVYGIQPYSEIDPVAPEIHEADTYLYIQERSQVMPAPHWWKVFDDVDPEFQTIRCLEWPQAKLQFTERFVELYSESGSRENTG